jgi:hypothetical protein
MNPRHISFHSLFAAVVLAVGCATDGSQLTNERHATLVNQEQARSLVFTYRKQATDLRELARRLEFEARYRGESTLPESDPLLLRANALLASAQDAEDRAREYQQQVPHGQVQ